ncbi:hypothetical protein [Chromobacterium haemolyticum]|uniref:hypothetical protein n=1 Tax=Chromobacterium haemolyticum TaxID=394935 RepID=UPI0017469105|nr:hypothetical protein [Chromobacterium haemolyticum]QOD81343.1 hypothetical protein IEZ30_15590 [Chromobacterium haemolyticum]
MSQIDNRPKPEAVQLRSAPFPESGLLPTTLAERRQNLNVQAGDENAEKARRRRRGRPGLFLDQLHQEHHHFLVLRWHQ